MPLSHEALAVLKTVKAITCEIPGVCDSPFVFPNDVTGEGLGGSTMLAVLKRMKRLDVTVHGCGHVSGHGRQSGRPFRGRSARQRWPIV